ncbi:unnamed protein product [Trifolium pratense]|uniref:Uncharacterized protein n=1 Tax=Trifolium pratense TaxID=57577 RepID=A0ACB0M109_TRIPR|nr:unnamed protein product [Trifolium pratense]
MFGWTKDTHTTTLKMSSILSQKVLLWSLILLVYQFSISCKANQQSKYLYKFIQSKRFQQKPSSHEEAFYLSAFVDEHVPNKVHVEEQLRLMKADKVKALPGQPKGPGCSSFGYGAMQELGPFRVNSDGRTLSLNKDAWSNVANVIFLESPAGVGFSYSNKTLDYSNIGDNSTARDSYIFLLNWLERFPQYKTRDFFIAGESYAGHYVPQLAHLILSNNKKMKHHRVINLKGIAVGNGWIDDNYCTKGMYDYFWMQSLNSDETHRGIEKLCDFRNFNLTNECVGYQNKAADELGNIDVYNIYAPLCNSSATKTSYSGSDFDPCSEAYTVAYLNLPKVQKALHAKARKWSSCSDLSWTDSPASILPTINRLISSGISIWIYSGDIDGRVPITSTKYSINSLKLPVNTAWRPWYTGKEVGGYVIGYKGLTLVTVRGAGHMVPSYQPHRALSMIASFLHGKLPPESNS